MANDKVKLILWNSLGVIICFALIPLITEAKGFQTYLNIAAFLGLYFGGVLLISSVSWIAKKIQNKQPYMSIKILTFASQVMIAAMTAFGVYFYDFSQARPHSYTEPYRYSYSTPKDMSDGWEIANASKEGIDVPLIETLTQRFVNDPEYKWQHSFLLAKNGKLLVEEYFYENDAQSRHDLRSANKSITSILVGAAIRQGFLTSEEDPISLYLPEYNDVFSTSPTKQHITIKDLLTMQSGLDANDWKRNSPGNENRIYKTSGDWIRQFLELNLVAEPGSKFAYATLGEMTLRQILTNASKMPFKKFAEEFLFHPLGIKNIEWTHHLESRTDVAYRMELSARDLLKLGQLYLNHGVWSGQQILEESWVRRSTDAHTVTTNKRLDFPDYGYLWWKHDFVVGTRKIEGFQAQGNGGQFLFVFPELRVTAVFTSRNFGKARQINPLNITREELIPMLVKMEDLNK